MNNICCKVYSLTLVKSFSHKKIFHSFCVGGMDSDPGAHRGACFVFEGREREAAQWSVLTERVSSDSTRRPHAALVPSAGAAVGWKNRTRGTPGPIL